MKKKIANALELVFLIVSFVLLWIPCVSVVSNSGTGTLGHTSVFALVSFYKVVTIPMCVLYALCAIMCIISILSKDIHKDGKAHCFVPILLFLSANWTLISCGNGSDRLTVVSSQFPAVLFEACLFAVVVIGFAKRSSLVAGFPNTVETKPASSQADELKKYKDLLDSGAITQDEYEEKKKQLLHL
jgi:hypothetical protein